VGLLGFFLWVGLVVLVSTSCVLSGGLRFLLFFNKILLFIKKNDVPLPQVIQHQYFL